MKVNLLTFAILFFACSRNIPTEKVYFNGRIWTGDKKNPHATAIYVKDSTIVFVGSDAEAVSRAQDGASKIDLDFGTKVPLICKSLFCFVHLIGFSILSSIPTPV